MELTGTIIVTVLVLIIVIGACTIDLIHNPCAHPRKLVVRRFLNWFLVGITYASTYFGRYNINVANNNKTYEALKITSTQFGYIVTVGSASYAVFVVVNGFVVDKIGGKRAMVIGSIGSGVLNICQGIFAYAGAGHVSGLSAVAIIALIYAVNNFFQTFCTSAICKVAVNWYNIRERGYFSGIFGVIISLGFYFAYQVNGVVYGHMHWCWIFFFPAAQLLILGVLTIFFGCDTPADAGFTYDPLTLTDSTGVDAPFPGAADPLLGSAHAGNDDDDAAAAAASSSSSSADGDEKAKKQAPSLLFLLKTVFCNPVFIILCAIDICLGWNRDGVLAWYSEILTARFRADTTSNQYALASGGVTIGGMFGSLAAGTISDSLFKHRRTPVAFIFYIGLTLTFTCMFFINSGWGFATFTAIASVWFNGLNGLITSTCAMDFAGTEATATAVGLLDGIQKIGSSAAGFMGAILKVQKAERSSLQVITHQNYQTWVYSLLPPAAFAIGLLITILGRRAKAADDAEREDAAKAKMAKGEEDYGYEAHVNPDYS